MSDHPRSLRSPSTALPVLVASATLTVMDGAVLGLGARLLA